MTTVDILEEVFVEWDHPDISPECRAAVRAYMDKVVQRLFLEAL